MNLRSISCVMLATFSCVPAVAQVNMHSDFGGYSIRTGNSIYSLRGDGTSQEFHRFGNIGMYSDSAGTTGESFYFQNGRYDSYRNYRRGWSGDGYSPYRSDASTYSRRSTNPSPYRSLLPTLPDLPPLPELPAVPNYTKRVRNGTAIGSRRMPLGATRADAPSTTTGFDLSSRLERLGITVDESKYSQSQLLDIESRVSCARRIERKGVTIDWATYTHSQLLDIESRVNAASRISRLGHDVDWQSNTHSELLDIESRLSASKRIARKGVSVDWKTHSHSQLLDIESRVSAAQRLTRKGVDVNWNDYTHAELLRMER